MAEFRMFKCLTLAFMRGYGQQFPCIQRVGPTKRLLKSCALYNVHEKSLIEGECELIIRSIEGKRTKVFYIYQPF